MKRLGLVGVILCIGLRAGAAWERIWSNEPQRRTHGAPSTMRVSGLGAANPIRVVVNGEPVAFADVQPMSIRRRVMVPLRGVFEHIGATIDWIPAKNLVRAMRGDTKIECWINKIFAAVDDDQVKLDVPPVIVAGRTLVPLRFFAEALGASVQWDRATSTVTIEMQPGAVAVAPSVARPELRQACSHALPATLRHQPGQLPR